MGAEIVIRSRIDADRAELVFRLLFSSIFIVLGGEHMFSDGLIQELMPSWVPAPRFLSIADPVRVLKEAVRRGARVVHVNPRRIESAKTGAGETVLIRPDTDTYLLAALIYEIDRTCGFDDSVTGHQHHHRPDCQHGPGHARL